MLAPVVTSLASANAVLVKQLRIVVLNVKRPIGLTIGKNARDTCAKSV